MEIIKNTLNVYLVDSGRFLNINYLKNTEYKKYSGDQSPDLGV